MNSSEMRSPASLWRTLVTRMVGQRAPVAALVIGLVLTCIITAITTVATEQTLNTEFQTTATRLMRAIELEVAETESLIQIARNHFDVSIPGTKSEFNRYAFGEALLRKQPGVEWFAFLRRVAKQDLVWYQRSFRSDTQVNEDGLPVFRSGVSGDRPEYYFFEQVIPVGAQLRMIGVDLSGDDKVTAAIHVAARDDTIQPMFSDDTALSADSAPVLVAPVFDRISDAYSRAQTLVGVIAVRINPRRLFYDELARSVPPGYSLRISFGETKTQNPSPLRRPVITLLGRPGGAAPVEYAFPERDSGNLEMERELSLGRLAVVAEVTAPRSAVGSYALRWPVIVFLASLAISLLMYLYIRTASLSRQQAMALAEQMSAAAKRSEERFRDLVESTSDWIWEIDAAFRYVYTSPNCRNILGYEATRIVGMDALTFGRPHVAPELALFPFPASAPQGYSGFERAFEREDGRLVTLESSGTPYFADDGRFLGLRGIDRDITERKNAQDQQAELRSELAEVSQFNLAGQLLSGVAHELNQPLSAIVLFNQASIRMLESGSTDQANVIHAMRQTAAQAKLAGDILKGLRELTARREPQLAPVAVEPLVRNALLLAEYRLKQAAIQVGVDVAPDLPLVPVDTVLITQVMLNLIHNAIDAMIGVEDRHLYVRAHAADGDRVAIEFSDSGPGVPPEMESSLFRPRFTTKPQGMGLGLPISRSILEAHDGQLIFGRGTLSGAAFTMLLPAAGSGTPPDAKMSEEAIEEASEVEAALHQADNPT